MSSKNARRKARRKREQERTRGKPNPATLFILGIALAFLLTVVGALLFGPGSRPGEPPWPGAVWSPSHGHWH